MEWVHAKWNPAVDLYRTPRGWALKMDLAGVRLQDVEVEIRDHDPHVKGIRRDRLVRGGWRHYSMEIQYNRFERLIHIPNGIAGAVPSYSFQEGMLLVQIEGKKEASHG